MGEDYGNTYSKLLKIRNKKDLKLQKNPYLKDKYTLRYYQIIGTVHMYMVKRFVLGDDCGIGKCVAGDTCIITSEGLKNFKDIAYQQNALDIPEDTFIPYITSVSSKGVKKITKFYYGGKKQTMQFKTNLGVKTKSALNHRWEVLSPDGNLLWKKTSDLTKKDLIKIELGNNLWGNISIPKNDAILLGIIISSEIKSNKENFYIEITSKNKLKFKNHSNLIQNDLLTIPNEIISKYNLQSYLLKNNNPPNLPEVIRKGTRQTFIYFMLGLEIVCGSGKIILQNYDQAKEMHILLLNLGIISIIEKSKTHQYILDTYTKPPVPKELKYILSQDLNYKNKEKVNYTYAYIVDIKKDKIQDVYDISVPSGNAYLANGMVSHNTLQTIATYTSLLAKDPDYKMAVICPSSAMYQWASEFDKFCNGITTQIVESTTIKYMNGKKLKSKDYLTSFNAREYQFKKFLQNKKNVVIFNYNTMCSDNHLLVKIMEQNKFMVVFDEATAFKNSKSLTSEYAKKISKLGDRVYGLSATIIKNNLVEAWSIYNVIMPGLFGSFHKFKKNYCIMRYKNLWKGKGKKSKTVGEIVSYKNIAHFKKTIDPFFLGRKKSEVAKDLPEIISRKILIKMNSRQQKLYDEALEGLIDFDKFNKTPKYLENVKRLIKEDSSEFSSKDPKIIDKLTSLIYCQQICNSPHLIDINIPSSKEEELLGILKNELDKEKVVIYTRFKKMVDRLEYLIHTKLKVKCTKITGDVKAQDRENNKYNFNNKEDCNIIIINSAAKEAINLQSSGYLIFYDLPFSYGDFLQIIGRIHRIGSKHSNIFLFYLMCKDSIDEKTLSILTKKKDLFDSVLGDSAVGAINGTQADTINTLFDKMKLFKQEKHT